MNDAAPLLVTGLGAQGGGLAVTSSGLEMHVPGLLPGETAMPDGDAGYVRSGPASPERRLAPLCPHVSACGGCSVQHMNDDLYARWKATLLAMPLAQRGIVVDPEPMLSVPVGSRRRATFAGRWDQGELALGFHGARTHTIEPIVACAVLRPEIVAALPLLGRIAAHVSPSNATPRVHVLACDNGFDVSIELGVPRAGGRDQATLAQWARQARVARLTVDGQPVLMLEKPVIRIAGVTVAPPPGAFLQAAIETEALLGALVASGIGKARRVADLFSGLGTLSLGLATKARVLTVDSDADLLAALGTAVANVQGLKPVDRLRRDLMRDPLAPKELEAFDAVVLDPPRAGAAAQCQALVKSKVRRVVMVSCNPATLARDLRVLIDGGFRLDGITPVDQFLFTAHLEAVAVLSRR